MILIMEIMMILGMVENVGNVISPAQHQILDLFRWANIKILKHKSQDNVRYTIYGFKYKIYSSRQIIIWMNHAKIKQTIIEKVK